jgi:hypothetical protein
LGSPACLAQAVSPALRRARRRRCLKLFSYDLQGSRQGKVVLIERFGVSDEAQRYSVKRYHSAKIVRENDWEHGSITFIPENRDFEPWSPEPGEFRIVAEWLGVIE